MKKISLISVFIIIGLIAMVTNVYANDMDIINQVKDVDVSYIANLVYKKGAEQAQISAKTDAEITTKFSVGIDSTSTTVKQGSEFTVITKITDISQVKEGILALGGIFEFDKNILEIKDNSIKGVNNWNFSSKDYNLNNYKFITDNSDRVKESGNIFQITFKVKENATIGNTNISLKSVSGGTGATTNGIVYAGDANIIIDIQKKEEITEPEKLTSDIYKVETDTISRIQPNTTIAQFKKNVNTKQDMVFTDKEGNVINDENAIIGTGIKLNAGTTLEFVLIVKGDIDGDGIMNLNDIAKMKLHYIEKELLTGIHLKAADLDEDGKVSVNDIAQVKLIYIGKTK